MGQQSNTNPILSQRNPAWVVLVLLLSIISSAATAQSTISALSIPLILPSAVVFDSTGNLYIADTNAHLIRRVDPQGNITTIVGTGTQGFSGDNGPATAALLDSPQGVALRANTLYIADTHNHRIRALDLTTGNITTIAGTGAPGYSGDNALATAATLDLPTALALDTTGNLYLTDTANHRIRRIDATTHIITTIAGNGTQGYSGDNALATVASIDSPTGIALDATGNLYLADTHNHRIRRIDATTQIVTTIAGTGTPGYTADNIPAISAALALPHNLTLDATGNLYLTDTANHRIRRIDTTGQITTIAGTGTQGYSGDNGPATAANLDSPRSIALSPATLPTIADTNNQRVRQLSPSNITTIAGLGATTPGTLTLSGPSVISYGTGQLTATLATSTAATGSINFIDTYHATQSTLSPIALKSGTATLNLNTLPTGLHSITATFPGDQTHTAAQSTAFTLTINPAPTLTTLITPTGTLQPPITLAAQVASTTTGTPTGNLTLSDSSTTPASTLATATLTSGTATLLIPTLATGTHALTATYSGDTNFQPSTSNPSTLTISNPTTPTTDFSLTPTATTQTIPSGGAATFSFTTQTQGNLSSPITLSASGLPLGATATFNPTLLPPGTANATFTLTITTLKSTASTHSIPPTLALLLLPILFRRKRLLAALALTLVATGCGDRINQAALQSNLKTYTITVTATATTPTGIPLTHSTNLTLNVAN